jgi:hypothetical protein
MSDLRTRIAAIIDREVDGLWEPLEVADAVFRELGLWKQLSNWHPGYYRYVTDWKADDGSL